MLIAVSTLIAKIIGAVYKIPLVHILGVEGIGMYQLIFPVYAAAIALTSGGVSVVISRRLAAGRAVEDYSGKGVVGHAIAYTLIITCVASLVLALAAPAIAGLQGARDIRICYYFIIPSIITVGISSCIRGVFLGEGKVKYAAGAQLIEQIAKLVIGLLLSFLLIKKGLIWGVVGAVIGVTASELIGLIYSALCCVKVDKFKSVFSRVAFSGDYVKEYMPVMLGGIILPISTLLDSLMVVKLLGAFGYSDATGAYGLMTGIVNTVVNMPTVIAIALAAAIVPTLSYSYAKKDACGIKERSSACVKVALIIGVPCFFGLFALSPHILKALYPSLNNSQLELAATLMRISAINVILSSSVQIYTAILQSLDMAGYCLRAGALLSVLRVAGEVALAYVLGIKGICLAWAVYNLLFMLVLIYKHAYLLGRNVALIKNVSKILLGGVIMYAPVAVASMYISNAYLAVGIGVAVGALLYLPLVLMLGIMSKEELMSLPFGNKIYAAARLINRRNYG